MQRADLGNLFCSDAKIFFKLETWQPDPDDVSITAYLRSVAAFQRFCTISAYRVAGGSEERATALLGASVIGTSGTKIRQEVSHKHTSEI